MTELPDPRVFGRPAAGAPSALCEAASRLLAAGTGAAEERAERELASLLRGLLGAADFAAIDAALASAGSVAVHRTIWRVLLTVSAERADAGSPRLETFAIALSIVAAAATDCDIEATLASPARLARILVEHRMLGGSETVALGDALIAPSRLPLTVVLAMAAPGPIETAAARIGSANLPPDPIGVHAGVEQVHLRLLLGSVLVAPQVDPFAASPSRGKGTMALTREVAAQLAGRGATVLPLVGSPQPLLLALQEGRRMRREVALQLFVSNALRRFRSGPGEPGAVISAHRAADAAQGGELRLSLSSPFETRDAEGFRFPLFANERVTDAEAAIRWLLAECGVTDVRSSPAIHPDRDPQTGQTLMFRPEMLPTEADGGRLH
jgi:hypothetical protein